MIVQCKNKHIMSKYASIIMIMQSCEDVFGCNYVRKKRSM